MENLEQFEQRGTEIPRKKGAQDYLEALPVYVYAIVSFVIFVGIAVTQGMTLAAVLGGLAFYSCGDAPCSFLAAMGIYLIAATLFIANPILPGIYLYSFLHKQRFLPFVISLVASLAFILILLTSFSKVIQNPELLIRLLTDPSTFNGGLAFLMAFVLGVVLLVEKLTRKAFSVYRWLVLLLFIVFSLALVFPSQFEAIKSDIQAETVFQTEFPPFGILYYTINRVEDGKSYFYRLGPEGPLPRIEKTCTISEKGDTRNVCLFGNSLAIHEEGGEVQKIDLPSDLGDYTYTDESSTAISLDSKIVIFERSQSNYKGREPFVAIYRIDVDPFSIKEIYKIPEYYSNTSVSYFAQRDQIVIASPIRKFINAENEWEVVSPGFGLILSGDGANQIELPDEIKCCSRDVQWSDDGRYIFAALVKDDFTEFALYDTETSQIDIISGDVTQMHRVAKYEYDGNKTITYTPESTSYKRSTNSIFSVDFNTKQPKIVNDFPKTSRFKFLLDGEWFTYQTPVGYWLEKTDEADGEEKYRVAAPDARFDIYTWIK